MFEFGLRLSTYTYSLFLWIVEGVDLKVITIGVKKNSDNQKVLRILKEALKDLDVYIEAEWGK